MIGELIRSIVDETLENGLNGQKDDLWISFVFFREILQNRQFPLLRGSAPVLEKHEHDDFAFVVGDFDFVPSFGEIDPGRNVRERGSLWPWMPFSPVSLFWAESERGRRRADRASREIRDFFIISGVVAQKESILLRACGGIFVIYPLCVGSGPVWRMRVRQYRRPTARFGDLVFECRR